MFSWSCVTLSFLPLLLSISLYLCVCKYLGEVATHVPPPSTEGNSFICICVIDSHEIERPVLFTESLPPLGIDRGTSGK